MKKKFYCVILMSLASFLLLPLYAESAKTEKLIKNIRSRYKEVTTEINSKGCQSSKTLDPEAYDNQEAYTAVNCAYYHAVFMQNERSKPVSAVGWKVVRTDFWFDDEAGEYRLHFVRKIIDRRFPDKIVLEYLYDENNNLIFYYKHDPIHSYENPDIRLYFHNGKLIKAIPSSIKKSLVKEVQEQAKFYVKMAEF